MTETLHNATGDERIAGDMSDFCDYFCGENGDKGEVGDRFF